MIHHSEITSRHFIKRRKSSVFVIQQNLRKDQCRVKEFTPPPLRHSCSSPTLILYSTTVLYQPFLVSYTYTGPIRCLLTWQFILLTALCVAHVFEELERWWDEYTFIPSLRFPNDGWKSALFFFNWNLFYSNAQVIWLQSLRPTWSTSLKSLPYL